MDLETATTGQSLRLALPVCGEEPVVVRERSRQELTFNVMPDRAVRENLTATEYRIWDRYVEVDLEREYYSSMQKSPDHLIFLSALIQAQKLVYVYMCHELGLPYLADGPEMLKIWPTGVHVTMPAMVADKRVLQSLSMLALRRLSHGKYFAQVQSTAREVSIRADVMIYLLSVAPTSESESR